MSGNRIQGHLMQFTTIVKLCLIAFIVHQSWIKNKRQLGMIAAWPVLNTIRHGYTTNLGLRQPPDPAVQSRGIPGILTNATVNRFALRGVYPRDRAPRPTLSPAQETPMLHPKRWLYHQRRVLVLQSQLRRGILEGQLVEAVFLMRQIRY